MIRYYKTIDSKLEKLSFFEDGCWINLVEPNHSEFIKYRCRKHRICTR